MGDDEFVNENDGTFINRFYVRSFRSFHVRPLLAYLRRSGRSWNDVAPCPPFIRGTVYRWSTGEQVPTPENIDRIKKMNGLSDVEVPTLGWWDVRYGATAETMTMIRSQFFDGPRGSAGSGLLQRAASGLMWELAIDQVSREGVADVASIARKLLEQQLQAEEASRHNQSKEFDMQILDLIRKGGAGWAAIVEEVLARLERKKEITPHQAAALDLMCEVLESQLSRKGGGGRLGCDRRIDRGSHPRGGDSILGRLGATEGRLDLRSLRIHGLNGRRG